ncbi:hypothetical protein EV198_1120 [Roseivirga ehrenbergii]|uniref:Seryl-tRNA synthetase n=1 Tax=Roseivirga ehrenbergii (strain DSM 102268 / JCM 13514 / KCTC 12282 / NCIMB 14502 / KMM 6017) TaxID=279360 RepID=A0A150X6S6_ROSEK|nr:hypothetical protein [Roseivirga ehrenbergii]KYG74418.1 hypothetical protein MB14_04185 [Roseivirga ehrenbergii]TCL14280.1 hypothetical protein EV198_1120 [Roseivirga ehrenbergii]
MKKLSIYFTFGIILLMFVPSQMSAATISDPITDKSTEKLTHEEMQAMVVRLNEIKDMDKSSLTREERKELRKEVRTMKKDIRDSGGGGLYISSGAIIVILLLIIIL